ncbi:(2Fe-2S)-binding protein [Bacillus sp. ISL-40]|uniref:2Fe-2S iron-sulfur cluster-binding protein n=1 Tax=unclassified Bacillus (in: firmicutes) TaxID=185979 RepID=UPI001BE60569|nr:MULTISPECIES: 2Fe-2S iron-sulfur cluster-binding protein [unclassified Bacillus (in: firmicutes)]MBT2698104.1 (2Fe-2S)-binding protein [Bacillus sp. ISL-40]MBT2742074.1 (2Fe-2S)-binding protein [Bacillus sp. ISL-77]
MNKRVFTVGSLIPGSLGPVLNPPSSTLFEKEEPKQQSDTIREEPHSEKIIVLQGENRFEIAPVKGKLLDAALKQGKPIKYKCQKGTCGQCTVQVLQSPGLSKPNQLEHKKLGNEVNNGYRLACQAVIQ